MNNDDPFEARLRAQPPPELPTHWRREILTAAAPRENALLAWLWPSRWAGAGMAAAWVAIIALRLSTPETASAQPRGPTDLHAALLSERFAMIAALDETRLGKGLP